MNRRDIETAIVDEVEEWPGVAVEFVDGGKHPKAKFTFTPPEGEQMILARPFAGTPSTQGLRSVLGDMRRVMKQLGATRAKPEPSIEETEARYSKPNPGREMREHPINGEHVEPRSTMAEQLAEHPAAPAAAVPATAKAPTEPEPELEPLGEGAHDIDEDRYHADPCAEPSLSGSIAKKMIEFSPYHAWNAHPRLNPKWEPSKDLLQHRIGRAFHTMLLGKGAPIEVYHYADWKKQVAKDDRDDALRRGATPLLEPQHEKIETMVRAARYQMRMREELAFAMAGGVPERVYIWREETPAGPIWCRMMADWTPHGGRYAVDWKTTASAAGPDGWGQRTMWDMGCDIQDAFYRRGFMKTIGVDYDALIFAVIEAEQPHAMMHHRVDYEAQQEADKDVQWAINAFGACLHRNRWPGYPLDMAWQTKPGWRAQRSELRRESGQRDLAMLDEQLSVLASMKDVTPQLEGAEVTPDNPFGLAPIESDGASE